MTETIFLMLLCVATPSGRECYDPTPSSWYVCRGTENRVAARLQVTYGGNPVIGAACMRATIEIDPCEAPEGLQRLAVLQ